MRWFGVVASAAYRARMPILQSLGEDTRLRGNEGTFVRLSRSYCLGMACLCLACGYGCLLVGIQRQRNSLCGICKCTRPVELYLQSIARSGQFLKFECIGLGGRKSGLLFFAKLGSFSLTGGRFQMSLFCPVQHYDGGFMVILTLCGIDQNLLVPVQLVDLARNVLDLMFA